MDGIMESIKRKKDEMAIKLEDIMPSSKANFGKGGGMMMFLILLLIVGGVLYYLHSQGKLKFPTMGQRVAQFGRDIKSLRKM